MKNNLLIPVFLLATTPFVVGCTKKPTDTPVPPAVTGTTETVTPVVPSEPVEAPLIPVAPTDSSAQSSTTVNQTSAPVVLTRTETVTYASPIDPKDPVEFSVTITDGVITAASATPKSIHDISQKLQTSFASEVSTKVVGKKAADFDVDTIGGASLTTGAFELFVRSF